MALSMSWFRSWTRANLSQRQEEAEILAYGVLRHTRVDIEFRIYCTALKSKSK